MPTPRDVLTPDALAMLQRIADTGSFAAAARAANVVPSALTYRGRQMEDALGVLLFDRSVLAALLGEHRARSWYAPVPPSCRSDQIVSAGYSASATRHK